MNKLRVLKLLLIVFCVVIFASACVSIKYGRMPDTEKLTSALSQNISTKADVLKILGQPRGYGKLHMSSIPEPLVIWFYEYIEASGFTSTEVNMKMLMVFFNKELYAGHMWFSSFEKLEKLKKKEENQ